MGTLLNKEMNATYGFLERTLPLNTASRVVASNAKLEANVEIYAAAPSVDVWDTAVSAWPATPSAYYLLGAGVS